MKQRMYLVVYLLFSTSQVWLFPQDRTIETLYPNLSEQIKGSIFSEDGILQTLEGSTKMPTLEPRLEPAFSFTNVIQQGKPSFIIESARVIPTATSVTIGRIYAALSRIQDLAGRTYRSSSRGKEVPLFETATRIEGPRKNSPLPDPVIIDADSFPVPENDTFYILLKDINFGNSYYKVEMRTHDKGLLFILSNAKRLSYGIIPVIGENNFISVLYIEPLAEGLYLYNQAGARVPALISSQVHMPSAIRKRLDVFIDWFLDGLQ